MRDLDKALAEIDAIRTQMARGTQFRGYGPTTFATTGVLALLAAVGQALWLKDPAHAIGAYLTLWIALAVLSIALISFETSIRSRRVHSGLAEEMIHAAIEQFVPAGLAGALLTVVLLRFAPESLWMLPGLWQIVFSLGLFASCRFLPRPRFAVGPWYLTAGLACLAFPNGDGAFSPWAMGVPYGIGQLLVAAVLHQSSRRSDGQG